MSMTTHGSKDKAEVAQEWTHPRAQVALAEVVASARQAFPGAPDQARIAKAIRLILGGHVALREGVAQVRSAHNPNQTYLVNGTCPCPDAHYRVEGGRCAHKWAVSMLRRVHEVQATLPAPVTYRAWWKVGLAEEQEGIVSDYQCDLYWFEPAGSQAGQWIDPLCVKFGRKLP